MWSDIVRLREEQGLSQMDLAVATGYSLRYIGDVEPGRKTAMLRTMNDLATLLNLRLGDLVSNAEQLLNDRAGRDKAPRPLHNLAKSGAPSRT
jgi:transcriptional regulator with XRE-family HTH domain